MNSDRTIIANLRLIDWVIERRFKAAPYDRAEMWQEGAIGLIKAARKHAPNKGTFSTYAVPSIWGAIMHYIRREKGGSGRDPKLHHDALSLNAPIANTDNGGKPMEAIDLIEDSASFRKFLHDDIWERINIHDRNAEELLWMRLEEDLNYKEIGSITGLNEMTIRRRLKRSLCA